MITPGSSPGISLQKGYSIRLEKNGRRFHRICLGFSWGDSAEQPHGSRLLGKMLNAELDAAVTSFARGRAFETIFFRKLRSRDGAINHSGDEFSGTMLDKEVITIDLPMVNPAVDSIYVHLNSFHGIDFGSIPYSQLRIYKGGPTKYGETLANFHVAGDPQYRGYFSMILGKLERHETEWSFTALGQPIPSIDISSGAKYLERKVHRPLT